MLRVIKIETLLFPDNQQLFEKDVFCSKKCFAVKKTYVYLQPQTTQAEIAQLVEHDLAKVGVASSSLVFRSKTSEKRFFFSPAFLGHKVLFLMPGWWNW